MREDGLDMGNSFPKDQADFLLGRLLTMSNLLKNKDNESLAQYLKYNNENYLVPTDFQTGSRETELLNIFNDNNCSAPRNGQNGRRALLSEENFRTLVLHECARCDRNAHQFSLIQIDLRSDSDGKALTGLVRKVLKRIRTTDEAGWLSSTSLGIFLPETNREGAGTFAQNVCHDLPYQIYTYPDFTTSRKDESSRSDEGRSSAIR